MNLAIQVQIFNEAVFISFYTNPLFFIFLFLKFFLWMFLRLKELEKCYVKSVEQRNEYAKYVFINLYLNKYMDELSNRIERKYYPVSLGCRIHWLHLCRGVRNECPDYDTKQSDVEVPAVLELWEMWSTPSSPLLPGPLWPGVVAPDRALSMG